MSTTANAITNKTTNHRSRAKRIALLVLSLALLMPVSAHAMGLEDIILLIQAIESTIKGAIGPVLKEIRQVNTTVANLEQQVVWPVKVINQTKGFIGQIRVQLGGVAGQIYGISNASATLASPSQFEGILRSARSGNVNQITGAFTKVYQPIPAASNAASSERNLADMDDATAESALKTAVISDQASQQMLAVATNIEQETENTAGGVAPMIEAQAQAADLENQAFLQRLLAAQLRQEAAHLAHENALRKRSADALRGLDTEIQQILQAPLRRQP